ncbi:unnamed protein product [Ilex paraguariensis]|uniref:Uncharacterized protein n=1 Tax=Ilex paraguariensis TaxID=185542 RepID=A0ABC8RYU9_9AQUA
MVSDIQILDLESSVEQKRKEKDTSKAENVQLKQIVARLESEKEEMVEQINELSVHVITQQYQTAHVHKVLPHSAENKGKEKSTVKKRGGEVEETKRDPMQLKKVQMSMVRKLKAKERKRKKDADYE